MSLNYGVFSVSAAGKLAYKAAWQHARLTWLNRDGTPLSTVGDPASFVNLDLSPDENHVVASEITQTPGAQAKVDLWRLDLSRAGLATRLTDDGGWEWDPAWSPDGRRVAFTHSLRKGVAHGLYVRPADASGPHELWVSPRNIFAPDWSHDGTVILFGDDSSGSADLWSVPVSGEHKPAVFLKTPYYEGAGVFSPSDRWVAYESNKSGRREVYVRPFPAGPGEFLISRNGGRSPRWRGDGKEIFFLALDGTMMAAKVEMSGGFSTDLPTSLFPTHFRGNDMRQYDVSKDGQRFLMPIPLPPVPIVVLLNWPAELPR